RAALELAVANEARMRQLHRQGFISQQELDQVEEAAKAARAQLALAQAQLEKDRTNLAYTVIRSPVSGVVVDRQVDVGQTVAASFQTPTLFLIAQDLSRMQIDTSFAEADIGSIRVGQPVHFKVDAFPDRSFQGTVKLIRLNPVTQQNVVTYDVVIAVDNPDQILLPGMTAYVNIVVARRQGVPVVSNAALRCRPLEPAPVAAPSQAGGVRRHHGGLRVGEIDAHEHPRLPRRAERRHLRARGPRRRHAEPRPARRSAQPGDRLRLPGFQPAAPGNPAGQRGVAAGVREGRQVGAARQGPGDARARGAGPVYGVAARSDLRRAAAARGHRPGLDQSPAPDPGGRADGQPGYPDRSGDHGPLAAAQRRRGDHRRPGDPRSGHRRPRPAPRASGGRAGGGGRAAAAPRGGVESAMMMGPMLSEARQAMGANRLRTLLTMLGMMIGVGAVIMMLAVGQGARDSVARSIASMGRNLFVVLAG